MFSRRKAEEKPSSSARKSRGNLPLLGLDADMEVDDADAAKDADSDIDADAVTPISLPPGVTHFGAYHRPSDGHFSSP